MDSSVRVIRGSWENCGNRKAMVVVDEVMGHVVVLSGNVVQVRNDK